MDTYKIWCFLGSLHSTSWGTCHSYVCRRGIVNALNAGASAIELDVDDVVIKGLIEDLRDRRYQISDLGIKWKETP